MIRPFVFVLSLVASVPGDLAAAPLAGAGVLERNGVTDCSAILIAPDLVATAAHCVASKRLGTDGGEDTVIFRTGAYPGRMSTDWPVGEIFVHPMHHGARSGGSDSLRHDAAILRLEAGVPGEVAAPFPLASEVPEIGERLLLATWPAGAGQRARERYCPVREVEDGVISLGCSVMPGESGGAVFRLSPDGPVLVGLVVAKAESVGRPGAFALLARSQILQIRAIYLD